MGRRGPRRKDGKREANGQLSRTNANKEEREREQAKRDLADVERSEFDTMYVALQARWRLHGIPIKDGRDQKAESWVGRLCMVGDLSAQQYDAAKTYLEERQANQMAIAPAIPADVRAQDINRVHGRDNGENEQRSRAARARWKATKEALYACQEQIGMTGNIWAAMDLCVERDIELPHMVGDLRTALNALVRHYKLAARVAA